LSEKSASLSAADRLEIERLIALYNVYEDTGNAEAWVDLFTKDGTLIGGGGKAPAVGRDKLIEAARRRWKDRPEVRSRVHWVSNVEVTPTADGAAAHSYQMTVEKQGETYRICRLSTKVDELRRENGEWRFHLRRVGEFPLK
jgi:uncharacterized protein (TIGR02246 family)